MRRRSTGRALFAIILGILLAGVGVRGAPPSIRLKKPARRALLIGIEEYVIPPEKIKPGQKVLSRATNLEGPGNDVEMIKTLLLKTAGFVEQDIRVLQPGEQDRKSILQAIDEQLIKNASDGDVSLLFFAGHGSYVPGGDPKSIFGQDETIVPADANLGVPDIPGSELAELAHRVLDNNARFIGIFDSCHSGTLFRGDREGVRIREIPPMQGPMPPPSPPAKKRDGPPHKRGALVLSAAQPTEQALEKSLFGKVSGVFTRALFDAMLSSGSAESTEQLVQRIAALMHRYGTTQSPDLDATEQRALKTLWDEPPSSVPSRIVAVATRVEGKSVILDIGQAMGIGEGAELVRSDRKPSLQLHVRNAPQLAVSVAESDQPGTVQVGDKFTIAKPGRQRLAEDARFFVENAGPSADELRALAQELGTLRSDARITWVADPANSLYTFQVYFSTEFRCFVLHDLCSQRVIPLQPVTAERIRQLVLSPRPSGSRRGSARECAPGAARALFIRLPPPRTLAAEIVQNDTWRNLQLSAVADRKLADYALVGQISDGNRIRYAWVQPQTDPQQRIPLPFRGRDWRDATAVGDLIDDAVALQRVKGWLTLKTPTGSEPFAYQLALMPRDGRPILKPGSKPPIVHEGETYDFVLERDSRVRYLQSRFVYIFNIDQEGNGTCLYPLGSLGCEKGNRLPGDEKKRFPLPSYLTARPPPGVDTLIMLTTQEGLPSAKTLLTFKGILKGKGDGMNDLEKLLFSIGVSSRGDEIPPTYWAIQHFPRITVKGARKPQ